MGVREKITIITMSQQPTKQQNTINTEQNNTIIIPYQILGQSQPPFNAKSPQCFKDFLHNHPHGGFINYAGEEVWQAFKTAGFDLQYTNRYDFGAWLNSGYKDLPLGAAFEPWDTDDENEMEAKYTKYS